MLFPISHFLIKKEHYLKFNGLYNYVQARNSSVFDVTTGDFDMEVEFRTTSSRGWYVRLIDKRGQGGAGSGFASYQLSFADDARDNWENTMIEDNSNNYIGAAGSPFGGISYNENDGNWHTARLTWDNSTGTGTFFIDGVQAAQEINSSMIGQSLTTSRKFTLGAANTMAQYFNGDIRSFRFNNETLDMNEGSGTTIIGSESTVLDIYGATWKKL